MLTVDSKMINDRYITSHKKLLDELLKKIAYTQCKLNLFMIIY